MGYPMLQSLHRIATKEEVDYVGVSSLAALTSYLLLYSRSVGGCNRTVMIKTHISMMLQPCQIRRRISIWRGSWSVWESSTWRPRPCPRRHANPREFQQRLGDWVLCRYWVMISNVCTNDKLPWSKTSMWRSSRALWKKRSERPWRSWRGMLGGASLCNTKSQRVLIIDWVYQIYRGSTQSYSHSERHSKYIKPGMDWFWNVQQEDRECISDWCITYWQLSANIAFKAHWKTRVLSSHEGVDPSPRSMEPVSRRALELSHKFE